MGLLERIWDIWTSDAETELYVMIDQFREDYPFEEELLHVLYLIEDSIVEGDYEQARDLFIDYAPVTMSTLDAQLFVQLLEEASHGY